MAGERSQPVLYGIGVGPGDPELLTLRGLALLQAADVVFLPTRKKGAPSLVERIVEPYLDRHRQQIVYLVHPSATHRASPYQGWRRHADVIAERLQGGQVGAFLTEGDPSLYSSFSYIRQALAERHPEVGVKTVPGVSAITAAAAVAGLSLADRNERVAIIPATDHAALQRALDDFDTVIVMKPSSLSRQVLALLERNGLADRAVWVRRVGMPEEEVVWDSRRLEGRPLDYFSLIIVRKC